jgi:hypothetical protein
LGKGRREDLADLSPDLFERSVVLIVYFSGLGEREGLLLEEGV